VDGAGSVVVVVVGGVKCVHWRGFVVVVHGVDFLFLV
jgi:hypothetical protein